MRGDVIYLVFGVHRGREKDVYFGAYRARADAAAYIAELKARQMHGRNWAAAHHDRGFVVREHVVDTDFEMPSRPNPRDRWCVRTSPKDYGEGRWEGTNVEVLERTATGLETRARYVRNYAMLSTFEPFRQHGRDFALVAPHYTGSAVLDLATGEIIAEEPATSGGFCPVGFYVPDWWDVRNGSILPGAPDWTSDMEWPDGMGGFVWGCLWGDDSTWKVQWLDLSRVREGVLTREERFGYLELATQAWPNPCLSVDPPPAEGSRPPPFINVSRYDGRTRATFHVEMEFDADTGRNDDWQRLRVSNME
jgi:hypothetical protein